MAGTARDFRLAVSEMTLLRGGSGLTAVLVNTWNLREMARVGSRSLAELLLPVAFDVGLLWTVAAQASARAGF